MTYVLSWLFDPYSRAAMHLLASCGLINLEKTSSRNGYGLEYREK